MLPSPVFLNLLLTQQLIIDLVSFNRPSAAATSTGPAQPARVTSPAYPSPTLVSESQALEASAASSGFASSPPAAPSTLPSPITAAATNFSLRGYGFLKPERCRRIPPRRPVVAVDVDPARGLPNHTQVTVPLDTVTHRPRLASSGRLVTSRVLAIFTRTPVIFPAPFPLSTTGHHLTCSPDCPCERRLHEYAPNVCLVLARAACPVPRTPRAAVLAR